VNNERLQKPQLAYRYAFGLDELEAAQACVEAHGFAVVKQLLPVAVEVEPNHDLGPSQSRTYTTFSIKHSQVLWNLFDYDLFLYVQQVLCQVKALTINRTAAIIHYPKAVWLLWYANWHNFFQSAQSRTFVR